MGRQICFLSRCQVEKKLLVDWMYNQESSPLSGVHAVQIGCNCGLSLRRSDPSAFISRRTSIGRSSLTSLKQAQDL